MGLTGCSGDMGVEAYVRTCKDPYAVFPTITRRRIMVTMCEESRVSRLR
jgi:hypothetical protein